MAGVTHGQSQAAFTQFVRGAGDELLAVGKDDFRHASPPVVVRDDAAGRWIDPAAGIRRGILALAPVERIAAAIGFDSAVIGAHGTAHALLVDDVEAALDLEPADIIKEETHAADVALVAGVFRNLVVVGIDGVMLVVVEVGRQSTARKRLGAE